MSVTADKRKPPSLDGSTKERDLDVFMKARNLLDYTLNVTSNKKVFRPDINKQTVELKKLLQQDNIKAIPIIDAMARIIDQLNDPTENIYVWLIKQLRQSANEIYIKAWRANNIRVGKDKQAKELRLLYQKEAISACVDLKAYISLAKRMCHLRSKRVSYWNTKTQTVMTELTKWHNSDKETYKNII